MAQGVNAALRGLVDDQALDIMKSVVEKKTGVEVWCQIFAEHWPHFAARRLNLSEAMVNDHIKPGCEVSAWCQRWLVQLS